jgi:hypothetical protein
MEVHTVLWLRLMCVWLWFVLAGRGDGDGAAGGRRGHLGNTRRTLVRPNGWAMMMVMMMMMMMMMTVRRRRRLTTTRLW